MTITIAQILLQALNGTVPGDSKSRAVAQLLKTFIASVSTITIDIFTTSAGQNTFTTSRDINNVILVIINGQPLQPADFSVITANTQVRTVDSVYPAGLPVQVIYT